MDIPNSEYIDLDKLFERRNMSPQLKRCVLAVSKGEDDPGSRDSISKGFAICTSQLQKYGYLKKGTNKPTKAGKSVGRSKAADKGHMEKMAEYEKLLGAARK